MGESTSEIEYFSAFIDFLTQTPLTRVKFRVFTNNERIILKGNQFIVQTIQAQNINLNDLIEKFSLEPTDDEQFFREWQDN